MMEFKVICNRCGNEDVLEDNYYLKENNKFKITTYEDWTVCLECRECGVEINLN